MQKLLKRPAGWNLHWKHFPFLSKQKPKSEGQIQYSKKNDYNFMNQMWNPFIPLWGRFRKNEAFLWCNTALLLSAYSSTYVNGRRMALIRSILTIGELIGWNHNKRYYTEDTYFFLNLPYGSSLSSSAPCIKIMFQCFTCSSNGFEIWEAISLPLSICVKGANSIGVKYRLEAS